MNTSIVKDLLINEIKPRWLWLYNLIDKDLTKEDKEKLSKYRCIRVANLWNLNPITKSSELVVLVVNNKIERIIET
jgi:hypothetical protein